MLLYDVESIPDLSLSKYQVFADSGIEGMLDAQTQFIRFLHRTSLLNDVGIHFLFDYQKDRPEGKKKLGCFFPLRNPTWIFPSDLGKS